MSDCSKHKKDLFGESDMEKVAEAIGDLHYETFKNLLHLLAEKVALDGGKDEAAGRIKLANELYTVAGHLEVAAVHAQWIWNISQPFMETNQ